MTIIKYFHKSLSVFRRYARPHNAAPRMVPALTIETTNICNARCVFCANALMTRKRESPTMGLFKKAVDDFVLLGGQHIEFSTTIGDPLLDKQLLERAQYVQTFPQLIHCGFVTTLQWLHLHDLDKFLDAGFKKIVISTTLSGEETYKEFFGVDNYKQVLKNLEALIHANNKKKDKLIIELSLKPTGESDRVIIKHPDFTKFISLLGEIPEKYFQSEASL